MSKRFGPEDPDPSAGPLFEPPHNHTATSRAAAASMRESANECRERVYEFIVGCGVNGTTREEVEIGLEMSGSTVRPRVVELLRVGKVYEREGVTRATESGRQAAILVAA